MRTPHSGYHRIEGFPRPFFEGWYFRVTLPEIRDNLSLIYHVYDPDLRRSERRGAGAQVCTPGGKYIWRESRDVERFTAAPHELALRMDYAHAEGGPEFYEVARGGSVHRGRLRLGDEVNDPSVWPPEKLASEVRWLRSAACGLLTLQFVWLGYEAYQRGVDTLFPSAAHERAHDELRATVEAQDGAVWIPGHGHIAYRAGKGTGAHGQAIFDVLQLLPKLPDGMFDLAALNDPAKLQHLRPRAQQALQALMANTTTAPAEQRFAALVIDEVGAGVFPVLFGAGMIGPDGRFGTEDDPYRRAPGHAVKQPTAVRPLLGYEVHTPYLMLRRP